MNKPLALMSVALSKVLFDAHHGRKIRFCVKRFDRALWENEKGGGFFFPPLVK
jgi:hypothetical protein